MSARILEDSYPLSPMQQGMLYNGLAAPHPGVDINQLVCTPDEDLHIPSLLSAWERVIERHAILRTAFRWRDVDEPLQDVYRHVRMPVSQHDLRDVPASEREPALAAFLESDRRKRFDLAEAPLMRLTLFRLAEARYTMVWTFHHMYLDGRSFMTVLTEVFELYEAIRDGRELDLPEPRPFRDYLDWLKEKDWTGAEAFWRSLLAGFAAPTPLVVEGAAPLEPGRFINDTAVSRRVPAAVTARLRALSKEHGVTLNTVVQVAWAALLGRYSGHNDVVFGAVRACRHSTFERAETMVGLTINTVPVRMRAEPGSTVLSCAQDLRAQWVAMREHEHTPLAQIARCSEVPGNTPLFHSIMVTENFHWKEALLARGEAWRRREVEIFERTNFPLTLMVDLGTEIVFQLQYDGRKLSRVAVERMLGHLCTLMEGMAGGFEQRIDDLPLLTPEEREQMLVRWNATEAPFPEHRCIHHLIEDQVERTPDAPAVRFGNGELTYRELNARANQIAHYLRSLGVGPGSLVGICAHRGLLLAAGLLGILKSGAGYVPLDPAYPAGRLALMMQDAELSTVLTLDLLVPHLSQSGARLVRLDSDWSSIAEHSAENPDSGATPESIAYIIYTSGSTGTPKGVMIAHRGVVNYALAVADAFEVTANDRVGQFVSTSFDVSVAEIFPTWICGATLVMRPDDAIVPSVFMRWVERERVTKLHFSTAFWHEWMSAIALTGEALPASLRLVVVVGEKASPAAYAIWRRASAGRVRWINAYGPTEITVEATFFDPGREPPLPDGADIPVGRPIANVKLYVLDALGRPVPVGVPGELHIGGVGVAKGYLKRPELTAERFIESPFIPGERLYKTGDKVRYLADGNLEIFGRMDRQVKIRGHRVELQEIESAINRHPSVRASAVLARETGSGDRRLTAFVASDRELKRNDLRRYLDERLPSYMVPAMFVLLDRLPTTPNGKVDRDALARFKLDAAEHHETTAKAAPRSATERILADIWAEVLEVPRVDIHDNFFELGGHSLLMLKIIDHAAHAGLSISPGQMFQYPTVAELAAVVSTSVSGSEPWSSLVPLRRTGRRPPIFLLHTTPGDILCYAGLVSALGPDQPCYGLQSAGLNHLEDAHTDIESMASYYITKMREVQPHGPYYLGGWCYGGVVSVEMAHQLVQQGERVAMVAVIEATAPRPSPVLFDQYCRWYAHRLRILWELGPDAQLRYLREKVDVYRNPDTRTLADMLEVAVSSGPLANRERVSEINLHAYNAYRGKPYPGRLTLFRASTPLKGKIPDPNMGWTPLAADLDLFVVPADHSSILHAPQVKLLASQLRTAMDKAMAEAGDTRGRAERRPESMRWSGPVSVGAPPSIGAPPSMSPPASVG